MRRFDDSEEDRRPELDPVLLQRARRRRARGRGEHKTHRGRGLAIGLVVLLLVGVATAVGGATWTAASWLRDGCTLDALQPVSLGRNSFVYAADGSLLGAIPSEQNRQPVPLSRMSTQLLAATVAIEDRRYWQHEGVDYRGIVRAALENVKEGGIEQGASTITQQLVRNLYIGSERSLERKVREACLALELEKAWSKERILQVYLNRVFYGNHAYGAEAAAQTYFSKPSAELGPAQAALVAGLAQAPSVYDPFEYPERARARRDEVLRAMHAAGFLGDAGFERALSKPLGLEPGRLYTRIREPFFFEFVRKQLVAHYGETVVRGGGLAVYTTIDPRFQRLAREAISSTLYLKTDPAAAAVSINPANGAIRAMAAVAPARRGLQFNLAAQGKRQAGSSFKTFVLAEAIRRGIDPYSTMYLSAPFTWQPSPYVEPWEVSTYSHSYGGGMPIASATLTSDNTVYAQLTLDLGPDSVAALARRMGVQTRLDAVPSIGLGSSSVSPLEMASAYATLAAGGVHRPAFAIRKVVLPDGSIDGQRIWRRGGERRVLTEAQAFEVTRILEDNVQSGTGTAASLGAQPAAGKTGTTDRHTDAWFCGYTPTLATAVWVGYPNLTREMASVHGIAVAGGTFPAEIWGLFMRAALASAPISHWALPVEPIEWEPFEGEHEYHPPPPPAEPERKKKQKPGSRDDGGDSAPDPAEESTEDPQA